MITKMPESICGFCGHRFNASTGVEAEAAIPHPGDVSICIECGEIHIFGEDMKPRALTDTERVEIQLYFPDWPGLKRASDAWRARYLKRRKIQ